MELVALTWGRANFREQLVSGYATIDRTTGQIYGAILAKRGREPRPPLDWNGIGAILQALAEGLGLRHKIDPAAAPGNAESTFDLYALAASAVLAVLTRPAGDDGTTAHEAIRGLLNASAATVQSG